MALAYLTATVTQGGADAFAQAEIATALSGISRVSFRIREILFELPYIGTAAGALAANAAVEASITRRTKAAMPLISDRDVIIKTRVQILWTTSGAIAQDRVVRYTYTEDDELLVVEDPLYLQVDSAATAVAGTLICRIGYERATISDVDRLTLLTQSLD